MALNAPSFSGSGNGGAGAVDLDNLDFQLLNDYLFDDQPTTFNDGENGGEVPRTSNLRQEDGIRRDEDEFDDLEDDPEEHGDDIDEFENGSRIGSGGRGRGSSDSGSSAATASGGSGDGSGSGTGSSKKRKTESRPKTQAQIDRRRERNRILARRTRLRKKFFFESLQKQVMDLQRENVVLKDIIKGKMGDVAGTILDKCNTALPPIIADNRSKATEVLERSDFNLMRSLQAAQRSFCITDPSLPDNPIVFASQRFLEFTGYNMEQVLGRNCRFLQGPETDRRKVEMIRRGISEGVDTSVCLLNYRADGSTFWNQFFVAALRDVNRFV
jgi:PAS domain S-box-containing protein